MIGQTVSRYHVLAKLGEGAMGDVYLAEHVDLHHRVAIKFLKATVLRGEAARARFRREAEVAARLDDPHLCSVIDFGEDQGRTYLVMRFCDGPDLRRVLAAGALPILQAVTYAIQIAEGLEAAHHAGIVHRDLKPSNVVIVHGSTTGVARDSRGEAATLALDVASPGPDAPANDGQARIVDFGLALLPDGPHVTGAGEVLGTPTYMAPEQVRGEAADARTDLWALGAILYEMVCGQPPFTGGSTAAVLDAVQHATPPSVSGMRPAVPAKLTWIIAKALRKQPRARYQSAAQMLVDLRDLHGDLSRGRAANRPTWIVENVRWLRWVAAGLVLTLAALTGWWYVVRQAGDRDGLPAATPSAVTSGVAWEGEPALSPDGSRIAFVSDAEGQFDIYVVAVSGGPLLRLTDHPAQDRMPTWFPDGSAIAFESDRTGVPSIWKTGQLGGDATLLLEDARDPAISPDGAWLAFVRADTTERDRVGIVPLADPARVRMLTGGPGHGLWSHREPAFSPSGQQLCYSAKNNLWLVDLPGGAIRSLTRDGREDRAPAWSPDGRHVYFQSLRDNVTALWRVRVGDGRTIRVTQGSGGECHPSVASDGSRIAFQSEVTGSSDLRIIDRTTGQESRLTGEYTDTFPSLSADGSLLAFISDRWGDRAEVWVQDLVAGRPQGAPRRLTDQPGNASHPALSPDGRWVAYYRFEDSERDLWLVPTAGGQPVRLTFDPASDIQPMWSPDGGRLAFVSDRDGRFSVWVMPITGDHVAGDAVRITPPDLAALRPIWSPDGSRIAFCAQGEVWTIDARGATAPVEITHDAQVDRLRWEAGADQLWACGRWGEGRLSLRLVSLDGAAPQIPDSGYAARGPDDDLFFDISRDGTVLVLTTQEHRARIRTLEATDGTF